MEFEWDPRKSEANWKKHGVRFEEAMEAFYDPHGVDIFDPDSVNEIRFRLIALSSKRLLMVGYTIRREEIFRIITARKATAYETRYYNASNG